MSVAIKVLSFLLDIAAVNIAKSLYVSLLPLASVPEEPFGVLVLRKVT
jgi:hypothetical protein